MAETPADEIRQAIATLRETAANATPGPWRIDPECADMVTSPYPTWKGRPSIIACDLEDGDVPWIALMHPGLAEPLAAWLEREAKNEEYHLAEFGYRTIPGEALAVARAINGSQS